MPSRGKEAERLAEALRKSSLALISAAQIADDHGDKQAAAFYDRRARANLRLLGIEGPLVRERKTTK